MRYALTYTLGGFERTNTVIVETPYAPEEAGFIPLMDDEEGMVEALKTGAGLTEEQATEVIKDKAYYLNNCDDVDVYI